MVLFIMSYVNDIYYVIFLIHLFCHMLMTFIISHINDIIYYAACQWHLLCHILKTFIMSHVNDIYCHILMTLF